MAVLLACATLISTGLGGVIAMRFRDRLHLLLGFSAGAVMGVVFFDVLPEVFSLEIRPPSVMLGCAAGFLAFFTLERMTALHGAREHEHVNTAHQAELGLLRRPVREESHAARTRGRRCFRRGIGGHAARRTRPGTNRSAQNESSSSARGRKATPRRS
jgi:zinc transporter ZupT